jgi:hypothetical protein
VLDPEPIPDQAISVYDYSPDSDDYLERRGEANVLQERLDELARVSTKERKLFEVPRWGRGGFQEQLLSRSGYSESPGFRDRT